MKAPFNYFMKSLLPAYRLTPTSRKVTTRKVCWVISTFILLFIGGTGTAQDITQNIRGSIKDKESLAPLIGSTVSVYKDSLLITGTSADINGLFKIPNIPIGRYDLVISSLGYNKIVMRNIIVNSAKEVVLQLVLEESFLKMNAIEVTAGKAKGEALNQMATVSARTFSVEETERYAGSRGDPARMASNFAVVPKLIPVTI